MANNLKQIKMVREIFELTQTNTSQRAIAQQLGISRNTVKSYLLLLANSNCTLEQLLVMDDEALLGFIKAYKPQYTPLQEQRYNLLAGLFGYISKELTRPGVTLCLLWEEYKAKHPEGYCYQQFCYHYQKHLVRNNASLKHIHKIGDCMMVDYAGSKMNYVDSATGELIMCDVLVMTMAYSGYTFVYASHSQQQPDFIDGINAGLTYFGGVPRQMLSDNLRTVVKKADRYSPAFTDLITELGIHYKMDLSATRVAKPKDKGKVEGAVLNTYRKIHATLRDEKFYSLKELNNAIVSKLDTLNTKSYQGKNYSRKDLFEEEKEVLHLLPNTPFIAYKTKTLKAQKNYHIELDHQYFSIPHKYIGQHIQAYYTQHIVELYCKDEKIATHLRERKQYHYHTIQEHMPSNHKAYIATKGYDEKYFVDQANKYGPHTVAFIQKLFTTKIYIEQTFNSCIGFFRGVGQYPSLRVEAACKIASRLVRFSAAGLRGSYNY